MSLVAFRESIAKVLDSKVPDIVSVDVHGGQFTLAELARVGAKSPSIRVACLGVKGATLDGGIRVAAEVQWGAFVIVRGTSITGRDEAALAVVNSLLKVVPGNRWDTDLANSPPIGIRGDNLYSSELDSKGLAMWAVTWMQKVDIIELTLADLANFATIVTEYDMVDDVEQVDARDKVELPQ